ncbi:MAG: YicC family protein [Paludibacteraceae bacterium]|nr:YicC family protein [Paludibacteraceae bacterium]
MILSMTGFGKATCELKNKKITIEIKSLNSKQLDLSTRVPSYYKEKELEMRNYIAKTLERGKIDLSFFVETIGAETGMQLNAPMMKAYKDQIEEAAAAAGVQIPADYDWVSTLLRLPDVQRNEQQELDEDDWNKVFEAFRKAVDALVEYRKKEGVSLRNVFTAKVDNIASLLNTIDPYEKERVELIKQRIADNLASLGGVDYDKNRFEQEMIYYIEKLDVNEEKNRLRQHLQYFKETMDIPEQSTGKKLGFIAQEMGREINTLGSKSNHSEMQKIVVKMKDELEQIKEQVLNAL